MSRFQELIVYCLVALVISGTNGLGNGPRYLMNMNGGMDPCSTCKQGRCFPARIGHVRCECFDGWAGTNCDILAWTLTTSPANIGSHNLAANCNHHGTWNGYSCECLDNWSGDWCQFGPPHAGFQNPDAFCSYHGHRDGVNCHCFDHWSGLNCQFATDATDATTQDPCHYHCVHGHCEPVYNDYGYLESHQCHCDNNWHGIHCDQQYTSTVATTLDHCHNHCVHGHCEARYDNFGHLFYHCRCDNNWHGIHCDQQYTSTDPCFDTCVHGRCVHGISSYYCHCDDSWQGENCDSGTILQCDDTYCVHGMCVYYVGPQGRHENSHCECYHGWHGQTCEDLFIHTTVAPTQMLETFSTSTSTPSTTQTPTTSSSTVLMTEPSTATTTTQTLPPVTATSPHHSSSTMVTVTSTMITQVACNKLSTLIDITQQTQADNQNASLCPSGSHTSHEAFVLKNCPASQNPANWQPGVEVMTLCSAGVASVPDYTAIAAFENGRYSAAGGLSGILVGCLADGFKMAVQRCDQPPHIVDIHVGGANLDNPNAYFAIV